MYASAGALLCAGMQHTTDTHRPVPRARPTVHRVAGARPKSLGIAPLTLSPRGQPMPPQPCTHALNLWRDAPRVPAGSDGLQEETTALRVPRLALREKTKDSLAVAIPAGGMA
ncbi:MAG: hypothetical protein Q8K45_10345 [Rubrivivax sp.]|nr:hypothetical protein [Rubrivivax sp.]